jgi:hypothetical protein
MRRRSRRTRPSPSDLSVTAEGPPSRRGVAGPLACPRSFVRALPRKYTANAPTRGPLHKARPRRDPALPVEAVGLELVGPFGCRSTASWPSLVLPRPNRSACSTRCAEPRTCTTQLRTALGSRSARQFELSEHPGRHRRIAPSSARQPHPICSRSDRHMDRLLEPLARGWSRPASRVPVRETLTGRPATRSARASGWLPPSRARAAGPRRRTTRQPHAPRRPGPAPGSGSARRSRDGPRSR